MGEADAHRYLQVLKEAVSDLKGPKPETWFDRLEQEPDQLQGALQWLLEHKDLQRAMELAALAWRFWMNRGPIDEGRKWLGAMLTTAEKTESASLEAEGLYGAGTLAFQQRGQPDPRVTFAPSLSISRPLKDGQ